MATILLVEDAPDIGVFEAGLLEREGHRVIRCGGAPGVFGACPLVREGSCALVDPADLIIFSCRLLTRLPRQSYSGTDLLRAYRNHPMYGRLPMLIVSVGRPEKLPGTGAVEAIDKFSAPGAVLAAVGRMLASKSGHVSV
jgi:CheY-like chemotaxis protein